MSRTDVYPNGEKESVLSLITYFGKVDELRIRSEAVKALKSNFLKKFNETSFTKS